MVTAIVATGTIQRSWHMVKLLGTESSSYAQRRPLLGQALVAAFHRRSPAQVPAKAFNGLNTSRGWRGIKARAERIFEEVGGSRSLRLSMIGNAGSDVASASEPCDRPHFNYPYGATCSDSKIRLSISPSEIFLFLLNLRRLEPINPAIDRFCITSSGDYSS